ncbi:MAG: hypothetical protein CVT88_04400 [Candidatus Altiarchaeales archaeon HGW-Altiarchaeales-1]|nr:MAG: hypothetical protein CVT88_04400 [Candidatus Altiarchaeales archaeon HGW-Altiarchaeales-1]
MQIGLISVKPEYVEKILNGSKKVELKKFPLKKGVKNVLVYATRPTKKIVCILHIEEVIEDTSKNLWSKFGNISGVKKKEFFEYFKGCKKCFAFKIKDAEKFPEPIDPYKIFPDFRAPETITYKINEYLSKKL